MNKARVFLFLILIFFIALIVIAATFLAPKKEARNIEFEADAYQITQINRTGANEDFLADETDMVQRISETLSGEYTERKANERVVTEPLFVITPVFKGEAEGDPDEAGEQLFILGKNSFAVKDGDTGDYLLYHKDEGIDIDYLNLLFHKPEGGTSSGSGSSDLSPEELLPESLPDFGPEESGSEDSGEAGTEGSADTVDGIEIDYD